MGRIVLANEMGGGWGHLLPLRAIADEFIQRGCNVSLLCRDYDKAASAFGDMGVAIEQSPAHKLSKTGFSLNYAQNLWGNGYWNNEMLGAHFQWWSDRFRNLQPDFILADYAPTALLSAMSLDIPRGAIGTGFTLPPMTTPLPFLHPWLDSPVKELSDIEDRVLATIRRHVPSVRSVAGIFEGAERFLLALPELDHFEVRSSEKYIGPVFGLASYPELAWPEGSGPRVFIYLSAANRCLGDPDESSQENRTSRFRVHQGSSRIRQKVTGVAHTAFERQSCKPRPGGSGMRHRGDAGRIPHERPNAPFRSPPADLPRAA